MKVPSFRFGLPALLFVLLAVAGCLATLPLSTWLWWAFPPLELYYSDAYFNSTMARGNPAATTTVEWLYKSAPGRADHLAGDPDVVVESPGNQSDLHIPMRLSSSARSAGWNELIQGPRVQVNAAQLESFLRSEFYGGQSFWRLLETPLLFAMFLLIVSLATRDWLVSRARKKRGRHFEMGPEWTEDDRHSWSAERLRLDWRIRLRDRYLMLSKNLFKRLANAVIHVVRKGRGNRSLSTNESSSGMKSPAVGFTPPAAITMQQSDSSLQSERMSQPSVSAPGPEENREREGKSASSSPSQNRAKRHRIFPGTARQKGEGPHSATWDESEWID